MCFSYCVSERKLRFVIQTQFEAKEEHSMSCSFCVQCSEEKLRIREKLLSSEKCELFHIDESAGEVEIFVSVRRNE